MNHSWKRARRGAFIARRVWIAGLTLAVAGLTATIVLGGGLGWAAGAIALALLGALASAGAADRAWQRRQRSQHVESHRQHRLRRAQVALRRRRLLGVITPRRTPDAKPHRSVAASHQEMLS